MSKRSGSRNRQRQKQVAVRLSDEEHALLLEVAAWLDQSPPSVLRYTFLAEYHPAAARAATGTGDAA